MTLFDQQLLRLKQVLGLTSDQDVAKALGLTKAALSVRKKRAAFPEDRVLELARRRDIDVHYILTGESRGFVANLAALREATRASKGNPELRDALFVELIEARVSTQEAALLDDYRQCSEADKRVISRMASTLALQPTQQVAEPKVDYQAPKGEGK